MSNCPLKVWTEKKNFESFNQNQFESFNLNLFESSFNQNQFENFNQNQFETKIQTVSSCRSRTRPVAPSRPGGQVLRGKAERLLHRGRSLGRGPPEQLPLLRARTKLERDSDRAEFRGVSESDEERKKKSEELGRERVSGDGKTIARSSFRRGRCFQQHFRKR